MPHALYPEFFLHNTKTIIFVGFVESRRQMDIRHEGSVRLHYGQLASQEMGSGEMILGYPCCAMRSRAGLA